MKETKFTEVQIVAGIKEYEAGRPAADVCRILGINKQTFYNWKNKYGGRLELLERKLSRAVLWGGKSGDILLLSDLFLPHFQNGAWRCK